MILSTTTNIWYEGQEAILNYNAQLPTVVADMNALGHQMHLVDSYSRVSFNDTFIDSDGIHPNALGYQHIADAFITDPWLRT